VARDAIEQLVASSGWKILDRTFYTQTTDPMFFEAEAGLAWWHDEGTRVTLHVAQATQSPDKDRENLRKILEKPLAGRPLGWRHTPCYPGGAFGGRDESSFSLYLAIAAVFSDRPVRIAFDRFEQFDAGIKACAAVVRNRLAFDAQFQPQALFCDAVFDGGGESTLAMAVVGLGALQSTGIYRIPHTAISISGARTGGAPAGSLRGFGIPQVTFAIESMMDEIAGLALASGTATAEDAIHFRELHAMRVPESERAPAAVDAAGCTLPHHLGNVSLCRAARQHPLWQRRAEEKARRSHAGLAYGVGFATCMESFGTNRDAIFIEVGFEPDGALVIHSCGTDMGQGSATSLAMGTQRILGCNAVRVIMGESDRFDALGIEAPSKPQPENPRYSPKIVSAMSASMFAFFHLHALDEACSIVFDHGLLPAACDLWSIERGSVEAMEMEWTKEGLRLKSPPDGKEPARKALPLPELTAQMHSSEYVTGAMIHTCFQVRFTRARFPLDASKGNPEGRWRHIDGLLVRRGKNSERLDRTAVEFPNETDARFPRSLYASAAHLVAVEVSLRTGAIEVVDAVTFLDAGEIHHRELLLGQAEGGFAQGLSHALLEKLPAAPEGTDGWWNLHRYPITAARHLRRLQDGRPEVVFIELGQEGILNQPKDAPRVAKKGIAEAVLTPVPAAIHNAIAHATGGVRLCSLPMTAKDLRRALAERAGCHAT
jgi:CO/xanthine dehydrogenase Mo-binding subunit